MKRLFLLAFVLVFGAVVMVLRHHTESEGILSVHDVLADAPQLIGKDITVTGVAGSSVALLGVGGFAIKGGDNSTLLAVSRSGVPLQGTRVRIHGVLRQAYASGRVQELVLIEDSPDFSNKHPAR